MRHRHGLTLAETCVILLLVTLLFAIVLPAIRSRRPSRRLPQSNMNLSSIYEASVKYSLGNADRFPGLDAHGAIQPIGSIEGSDQAGDVPRARFALLIYAGFLDPLHATSPFDRQAEVYRPGISAGHVEKQNHSYAMQRISNAAPGAPHNARTATWGRGINPRAVIMSDRNTGTNASNQISSVHMKKKRGQWHGSVCWGDGNVRFERSPQLATVFPGGQPNADSSGAPADHLFKDDHANTPRESQDALMVFQDNLSGSNQN